MNCIILKDSFFSGGSNKTGLPPKSNLKKPNSLGCDSEDLIQRTPPDNVITVDTGATNNCQNIFPKNRAVGVLFSISFQISCFTELS
jgi:hypothetical protein